MAWLWTKGIRLIVAFLLCALIVQPTGGCPILWSYAIDGITALSVSDNGDFVVVGCEDGWYYIFDTWGTLVGSGHVPDAVVSLDITDTGDFILGFLNEYTFCTREGVQRSSVGYNDVQDVSISSEGLFSLACSDRNVLINSGTSMVQELEVSSRNPFGIMNSDGTTACAASDAGIIVFEISEYIDMWSYEASDIIKHLFVSKDGREIVFSAKNRITYMDVKKREPRTVDVDSSVVSMAATPTGDIVLAATEKGLIWLEGISIIGQLDSEGIQFLSLSEDGLLAITGKDSIVQVITRDGAPLLTYDVGDPITGLEMSWNQDLLVVFTTTSIYTFQLFEKIQPNTNVFFPASRKTFPLTSPLEEVWSLPIERNAYFYTGDVNGDGKPEIVLKEGTALKVIDGNGTILLEKDFRRKFGLGYLLDVDGDTVCEIPLVLSATKFRFAVYEWGEDNPDYYYLDKLNTGFPLYNAEVRPLFVIDSNNDGNPEILVAIGAGHSCKPRGVASIDYASGDLIWFYQSGTDPMAQAVADINNDGSLEIVTGSMAPCTCPEDEDYPDCDSYVTALTLTGEELWKTDMGHGFLRITVSTEDINESEGTEIIEFGFNASENWGNISILTCGGDYLYNREFDYSIFPGAVSDIDGDGLEEIVVADRRGYLTMYTGDLQQKSSAFVTDDLNSRARVFVNDFNGDGFLEIFLILEKELFIFDKELDIIWQKEFPEPIWWGIANFSQCKNTLLVASDKLYAFSYTTGDSPCPLWTITERSLTDGASTDLDMAESLFLAGKYRNSKPYYEAALEKFERLEDERIIILIFEKIVIVSEIIFKQDIRIGMILLAVCDAVLCAFLLYSRFTRRWSRLAEGALLLSLPALLGLFQVHDARGDYLRVFVNYAIPFLLLSTSVIFRENILTSIIILEQNILNFLASSRLVKRGQIDSVKIEMLAFTEISPNPYNISKPIGSRKMFFGRQDIIDYVRGHISRKELDNILVIHGERRVGKTSLLYQLRNYYLSRDHIPVYINMQAITDRGTGVFFYNLSGFIVDAIEKTNLTIERPPFKDFQNAPTTYFRKKIVKPIEEMLENRKLVLMFDEFEELHKRVEDRKIDEDALSFLRSLMLESSKIAFIFVGTHRLTEIMGQYWSILFNIALHKKIDTLSKEDTIDLVVKPVARYNMRYQDNAKEYIYRITGGHPYFVQLLCLELVDYHNRTKKSFIDIDDINEVLEKILERGYYHFRFVWEQSEKDEKIFLAALAELENAFKMTNSEALLSLIRKHLPHYTLEKLLDTSDRLLRREVIIRDKDKGLYKFKIEIIKMWISQHRRLYEIIEEVRE